MPDISTDKMLQAGVHFGHLRKKWNPKMSPYIFMEKKGIHIIDLNKTKNALEKAGDAMRSIARSGRQILFVATKKQAKEIIENNAARCNMPFVTERWLGGMLTNFATIRKSVNKMRSIDKLINEASITKKERLMLTREKNKMERVLGGIADMKRIPSAIFIVDISFEHIALVESKKLGMNTFAMVDTNSDPNLVDFPVPANDDASKSIELITNYLTDCIIEGLKEREQNKDLQQAAKADEDGDGEKRTRRRRKKADSNDAAPEEKAEASAKEGGDEAPASEEKEA